MKIAISSTGKTIDDVMDSRFGRCNYFIIYDLDNDEYKAVENKGITSGHGAGIAAAQQILDENVDVVISGRLGPNSYRIIEGEGIAMLQADQGKIRDIINDYKENKLSHQKGAGAAHAGLK